MKNLLKITAIYLFAFLMFSCNQEENNLSTLENQLLQLIEKSQLENNALFIYNLDDNSIKHEIKDGWETGWESDKLLVKSISIDDPGDELCRGGGLSFAKCIKKNVDSGKCVTVFKDGGDYVAVEAKCPDSNNQQ